MLSRQVLRSRRTRALTVASGLLLIVPLLAMSTPAVAAPDDTAPSAPGDIGLPRDEYLEEASNIDQNVDIDVEERADACRRVGGEVSLADLAQYDGPEPTGDGRWEYRLCAETAAEAARIASEQGTVENMKRFCSPDAEPRQACSVFIYWHPEIEERPPIRIEDREDFFTGFLQFSPELRTSPPRVAERGLITNFPIWFWDDLPTFPKPFHVPFFGGITGVAFHLQTTWETDGHRICSKPGTIYRPGRHRPDQPSPDCGYTYKNLGTYNVHGEKTWLVIAQLGGLFPIPIVFVVTFSQDFTVPVKEAQVLGGGDPRQAPVR